MTRLAFYVIVTLLAGGFCTTLWPRLRSRGPVIAFAIGEVLFLVAWMGPLVHRWSVHDALPLVGVPFKLFGSFWLVASVLTIVLGMPVLILRIAVLARQAIRRWRRRNAVIELDRIDVSRRGFLAAVAKGVPVAAGVSALGGVVGGEIPFRLKKETVPLKNLPPALDGFKIGQITDLHVGAFISPADVRRAVAWLNAEGVDLQVMTGDLVDDLQSVQETFDALGTNQARHGMLAVLGNHEHWRGIRLMTHHYQRLVANNIPVKLLVDESTTLEHNGVAVRVVGVDYPFTRVSSRLETMRRSAEKAFAAALPGETLLCLSHHPDFFPIASRKGARLTISGHTHGGQVAGIGSLLARLFFQHVLGWYGDGDNKLYVSGGTGHWLPFRIGVPAEVTVLTLKSV